MTEYALKQTIKQEEFLPQNKFVLMNVKSLPLSLWLLLNITIPVSSSFYLILKINEGVEGEVITTSRPPRLRDAFEPDSKCRLGEGERLWWQGQLVNCAKLLAVKQNAEKITSHMCTVLMQLWRQTLHKHYSVKDRNITAPKSMAPLRWGCVPLYRGNYSLDLCENNFFIFIFLISFSAHP